MIQYLLRVSVVAGAFAVAACSAANNGGGGTPNNGAPGAGATGTGGTTDLNGTGVPAGNTGGTGGTGAASPGTGVSGVGGAGSPANPGTGGVGSAGMAAAGAGMGSGNAGSGSAGSGSVMGSAGSGAAGASGGPVVMPPCTTNANQVIVMGDSYINWATHTFGQDLANEAGETWPMYAVGGYSMGSGGIGLIPPQFDQALAANPDIKAVVMDGGGNDILIPDTLMFPGSDACKNSLDSASMPACQMVVQTAIAAAEQLMMHMADSGVSDVVYLFYPHVPDGTALGGDHPNAMLDYALPMTKASCDGAEQKSGGKLRCHFLDLIPIFDGHPEYFAALDVHENSMGSAAMAKAVWQLMKDNCIAQKASSGCCMQ